MGKEQQNGCGVVQGYVPHPRSDKGRNKAPAMNDPKTQETNATRAMGVGQGAQWCQCCGGYLYNPHRGETGYEWDVSRDWRKGILLLCPLMEANKGKECR